MKIRSSNKSNLPIRYTSHYPRKFYKLQRKFGRCNRYIEYQRRLDAQFIIVAFDNHKNVSNLGEKHVLFLFFCLRSDWTIQNEYIFVAKKVAFNRIYYSGKSSGNLKIVQERAAIPRCDNSVVKTKAKITRSSRHI